MISFFAAIFLLTFVVVIHETGHYIIARWHNVHVPVFSVGFGPEIVGFTDKRGTRWRLSALPLGGYVKLPDSPSDNYHTGIASLHPLRRILFFAGGPLANALLALLLWVCCAWIWFSVPTIVTQVTPDSPAALAGLICGDTLVDSTVVPVSLVPEKTLLSLKIRRSNQHSAIRIVLPSPLAPQTPLTPYLEAQLGFQTTPLISNTLLSSVSYALCEIWTVTYNTVSGLWQVIQGPSQESHKLLGPLGIMTLSRQIWSFGLKPFLSLMAAISLVLGLTNLLPIPVLDGGGIVLCLSEWVTGKPVTEKAQDWLLRIGIAILGLVFVISSWNDIKRLFWIVG